MTATAKSRPRKRAELALTVQNASRSRRLPARARLARWMRAALERTAVVTLRFVGPAEGRALNARYRRRDYATNVLTFAYEEARPLAGDIVICPGVAAREARAAGKPLEAHYAHLVVHGTLHLQGYDHRRARDAAVMERRETAILRRLGYPDPYREPARTAA